MTTFENRPFMADSPGGLPERNENVPLSPEAPPTYTEEDQGPSDPSGLIAAFVNLRLPTIAPALPTPEHCLAHLKILHVFHKLKEDVGYSNGLFGLWDANAEVLPGKERDEALAKTRQKRWTLYVARAAERFQDWWINVLCQKENAKRLEWKDMVNANLAFKDFTSRGTIQIWTESDLPPIDILMVWHSFMLNPRNYLEDCLRFGLCDLWATGMPWSIVNTAIDTDFNYNTSQEAIAAFVGNTNHNWNNRDDSMTKSLLCPRCSQQLDVLWTTCGQTYPSWSDKNSNDPTTGTGYGDKEFSHICHGCGGEVTHDILRVAKFKRHTEQLVTKDWPLGGTIIDPRTGFPDAPLLTHSRHPNFFPNRLITLELGDPILSIFKKEEKTAPSMDTIKRWIEQAIKQDDVIRKVNKSSVAIMGRPERLAIRKTMSRYWDNSSIFALELGSAVLRQAVFVDKMHDIDWLHSSAAIRTMKRLLIKYQRFIAIIASHPNDTAVPTLDIDLAWHTSQLSPRSYFAYTMSKCRKFIDHDDKIGEDALSTAFEWTSKTYEKLYREVYSECTCWYCEAIRFKHISNSGRIFGTSKHEKILNNFYDSGAAKLCPPEGSAHVSSHNAVRVEGKTSIFKSLDRRRQMELDRAYEKACKRADAKGRERPVRDHASYGAWGYQYPIYGPYMAYPVYGGYYAGDPCSIPVGAGMPGSCAAGTCGGGIASGACGGANGSCGMAGSCGGGSGGGGCGGGGGGGCGGGGGGCGGGGGGGCGGGG